MKARRKEKTPCAVEDCHDAATSHGLCNNHQARWHACKRPDLGAWIAAGGPTWTKWERMLRDGELPEPTARAEPDAPPPDPSPKVEPRSHENHTRSHENRTSRAPDPAPEQPPPEPTPGNGYQVCDGAPPRPKRAGGRLDPLTTAIRELEPGQHLRISSSRISSKKLGQRVIQAKKSSGKRLRYYTAADGDLIVAHAEEVPV